MSVVTTISQEPTSDPFSAMDLPNHGLFVMTTESYGGARAAPDVPGEDNRRRAATSSPVVFLGGRQTAGFHYNGGSDAGTSSKTTGTSNPLL